jgi:hypothetical protein
MRKPNTDPLLQRPLRRRKNAEETNDSHEPKKIGNAANTLFKGTPPPNAKSAKHERERGERS